MLPATPSATCGKPAQVREHPAFSQIVATRHTEVACRFSSFGGVVEWQTQQTQNLPASPVVRVQVPPPPPNCKAPDALKNSKLMTMFNGTISG